MNKRLSFLMKFSVCMWTLAGVSFICLILLTTLFSYVIGLADVFLFGFWMTSVFGALASFSIGFYFAENRQEDETKGGEG